MGYEEGLTGKLVTAFQGNWRKLIYGLERNRYQQLNTNCFEEKVGKVALRALVAHTAGA